MATSKTFDIGNGVVLNVSYSGSNGPTLVFLHFWGGSSRTFSPVTHLLSSNFRTIAVDFRGWGASTGPEDYEAYSIQTLADDIEALITKLEVKRYIIVGHSMGGKVAQLLAGRGRLTGLEGLVLVAPAPASPLVLPAEMKVQQLSAYTTEEIARFVATNVLASTPLPEAVVNSLVEYMLKGTPAARDAWPNYAMIEDVVTEARMIAVPVLVVAGSLDRQEPVDRLQSQVVEMIAGASMVIIEGSGHLIPVEAPESLAKHIQSFAGRISK